MKSAWRLTNLQKLAVKKLSCLCSRLLEIFQHD
jgi:hypothetical protein